MNYYRATAHDRTFPALSGRHETRVCVVGAGFAGLNTALGLTERGVRNVLVLDAHSPGFGASGRNGGFVRSEEHTSELQSLMRISYAVFCLKKKKYETYDIDV